MHPARPPRAPFEDAHRELPHQPRKLPLRSLAVSSLQGLPNALAVVDSICVERTVAMINAGGSAARAKESTLW